VIARSVLPTDGAAITEFVRGMRGAVHVALEEGTQAQWLHDLCRVGARNLRRAGVSVDEVMKLGRWKTASMFQRYNIIDEEDLNASVAKLAVKRAAQD